MNKTNKVLKLYKYLQTHNKCTTDELAALLNCCRRSVFRYLNDVKKIFPIATRRGKDGYVCLKEKE